MRRTYIVLLCIGLLWGCDHEENIIEEEALFVKFYGDAGAEQGIDVIETPGGYMLVGSSNSGEIIGGGAGVGESDFYILFVDKAGNRIRQVVVNHERVGRATADVPSQVIRTGTDNDYDYLVVGTTTYDTLINGSLESQSDVFLVKLSATGDVKFKACYGNVLYTDAAGGEERIANEYGVSVAEVDNGYFILGTTTEVDRNKEGADGDGAAATDLSDILLVQVKKETETIDGHDALVVISREIYGYSGEDRAVSMVSVDNEVAFVGQTDRESADSGVGNKNILFVLTEQQRGFITNARVIGGTGNERPYRLYKREGVKGFYMVGENAIGGQRAAFIVELSGVFLQRFMPQIGPREPGTGRLLTDVVGYDIVPQLDDDGYWIAGTVLENRVGAVSRNADMLLMRTDLSGVLDASYGESRLGGNNYGGVEDDEMRRVMRLESGDLLLFGTVGFEGGSRMMCLMKTNAEGVLQK